VRRPLSVLALTALLAAPLAAQTTPAPTPAAPPASPKPVTPAGTRAATPGTQTEDDLFVGIKRPVGGTRGPEVTPAKGRNPRTGAGTSPNTGRSGGDDELDELEIERRTAGDQPRPNTGTLPPPKPSVAKPVTGAPAPGTTAPRAPTPTPTPRVP
jgi:hypothetical protein